jgi:hypothetical protein
MALSRRAVALVSIAVVALGAAAWWCAREHVDGHATRASGANSRRDRGDDPLAAAGGTSPSTTSPVRTLDASVPLASSVAPIASLEAALAAGSIRLEPSREGGLEVEVVRRGGHEPVAGAIVAEVGVEDALRSHLGRAAFFDDVRRLFGEGVFVRTDAAGRARLPRRWPQLFLFAECGGMRGMTGAGGGATRTETVEIAPPTSIAVQVVDAEGRARGGVRVRLLESLVATTDDATGVARFADLELDNEVGYSRALHPLFVSIDAPLRRRPESEVDWSALDDPIRLVLPVSGSMVVRLVDSDRQVVPIGGELRVWAVGEKDLDSFSCPLSETGVTSIPCVELGPRFSLSATAAAHDTGAISDVAGPVRAGEVVTVDVVVGKPHRVLVGRAVDVQGRPIRAVAVVGWLRPVPEGRRHAHALPARLSEEGTFRVDVTDFATEWAKDWQPSSVRWKVADRHGDLWSKETPFPATRDVEEVALGDVSFEAPPVVAHGVVVDDASRPMAQVAVEATPREGSQQEPLWATTDEEGCFEIHSSDAVEGMVLCAIGEGGARSPDTPLVHDAEMRLVVTRRGSIEGSVRKGGGPTGAVLSIELVSEDGDVAKCIEAEKLAEDPQFHFENLKPGRYDVRFVLENEEGHGEEIAKVAAVEVRSGETVHDARLVDFDAWSRVRSVEVDVTMPDGSAPAGLFATTLTAEEGRPADWSLEFEGGAARLPTTREHVDVAVTAPWQGTRPAIVRDVADRASVQLQRGIPVRFVVAPLPAELAGKQLSNLDLATIDRRFPDGWLRERWSLDGATTLTADLPLPGTYKGALYVLVDPSERKFERRALEPFVVADSTGEQTVELKLAPKPKDDH